MIDIGSLNQGTRTFSHVYQYNEKKCQLGVLMSLNQKLIITNFLKLFQNFKWL